MVLIFRLVFNSLFLFLLHFILVSKCESQDSIASLTKLVASEDPIFGIREFQRRRINELEKLRRTIEFIGKDHNKAFEDVLDYLSNPINAYKLIKRMVIDWKEIHDFVEKGIASEPWNTYMKYAELPAESDLLDAIHGLTSIENDIDGPGSDGSKMTWVECYDSGVRLYDNQDFSGALLWLQQALEKIKDTDEYNDAMRVEILEYIAYSHYMLGDVLEATLVLEKALEIPVANSTVADSRAYFLLQKNSFVHTVELKEPHYTYI